MLYINFLCYEVTHGTAHWTNSRSINIWKDKVAVNMPNCPGTASKNKGFPQIVAFLKEDTEVVAVATPIAQHEHHN